MGLYCGIDLHSNNSRVVVVDESDRAVFSKRLPNDLGAILRELAPYRNEIVGIVVESTFNWYWLVDGLVESEYPVFMANPSAIQQYSGLKYTDDDSDARWLAHLLRLGVLPQGYIYPREQRPVRDLLRKRSQLVRQKVADILSIQNLFSRNLGLRLSADKIRKLTGEDVDGLIGDELLALAVKSTLSVLRGIESEIDHLETVVKRQVKQRPWYILLKSVPGIGEILALTIMLETGDIARFVKVGNFASYCRCVGSKKLTNGKVKGKGNTKNGNKYLAWAFIEAAHFAIRFDNQIQRYYQRKKAKTKGVIAIKAVAHKLARACYFIMKNQTPFNVARAFA